MTEDNKELTRVIKHNTSVGFLFERPTFLDDVQLKDLISALDKNDWDLFISHATTYFEGTKKIDQVYTYFLTILKKKNAATLKAKKQAISRLLKHASHNWLGVTDPQVVDFCKQFNEYSHRQNKIVDWFDEYRPLILIERKLSVAVENIDHDALLYFRFIQILLEDKKINEETFEGILKTIEKKTTILRDHTEIGSLLLRETQEQLGFKIIRPHIGLVKKE